MLGSFQIGGERKGASSTFLYPDLISSLCLLWPVLRLLAIVPRELQTADCAGYNEYIVAAHEGVSRALSHLFMSSSVSGIVFCCALLSFIFSLFCVHSYTFICSRRCSYLIHSHTPLIFRFDSLYLPLNSSLRFPHPWYLLYSFPFLLFPGSYHHPVLSENNISFPTSNILPA